MVDVVEELEKVRRIFPTAPYVASAWVFGSIARGRARPDSDLDVALLLGDPDADARTFRRELFDLAARLEDASGRRVDLVVLGPRDPIVAHRVLSEGLLLYDAAPQRRVRFVADVLSRYFDWAPRYEAAAAKSLAVNRAWAKGA